MMTLKQSFKTGLGFGLTSGVITTLGLIVGLYSGTHSEAVVLGGIFVIAVADALSDALGMHMSVESDKEKSTKQVWEATFYTFLFKFVFALTFAVPVLLFALSTAVWVSIGWGILLISIFSFYSEKQRGRNPWKMVLEHLLIAVLVIIATHYVGELVSNIRR